MTYYEGALFGLLGCFLYQLVRVYQFRTNKHKWPWQDKKTRMTIGFFIFGVGTKSIIAFFLAGMMTYTNQINGAWAAFLIGMVAERIIIVLADKTLRGMTE